MITGASSGLGQAVACSLAQIGCTAVLACRSLEKAEQAKHNMMQALPHAAIDTLSIDLSAMDSVRSAAATFKKQYSRLDILVNNAGIMYPSFTLTSDGFESQLATNSLGHFLLTALLIDAMPDQSSSRITWVSSLAHRTGKIHFKDLHMVSNYSKAAAYSQSKLACLMYTIELDRRLKMAGKKIISNAAHPGAVRSNLSRNMSPWLMTALEYTLLPLITHSTQSGSVPILQASLSLESPGGQYYGPQGFFELKGPSGLAKIAKQALNKAHLIKLWQVSESLTGAHFDL